MFSFSGNNDQIYIEEPLVNFRYSLLELGKRNFFSDTATGLHIWEKTFNSDGWIICDTKKTKIDSIAITYNNPISTTSRFSIDFSNYIVAIMEHIFENKKVTLMRNGLLQEF